MKVIFLFMYCNSHIACENDSYYFVHMFTNYKFLLSERLKQRNMYKI